MSHKYILYTAIVFLMLIAADVYAIECDSCEFCNSLLTSGTQIELNQSISIDGTCISKDNLNDATIDCRGHNISYSGTIPSVSDKGIILNYPNNVTIMDCNIKGFTTGISITNTNFDPSTIRNVTIRDNLLYGIDISSSSSTRVNILNNTIINNCIHYEECSGIRIHDSSNQNISYNNIQSNEYGIEIVKEFTESVTNNVITHNIIINNRKEGINLVGTGFNNIEYNRIRYNSPDTISEISIDTESNNNDITYNALKNHIIDNGISNTIHTNTYSDLNVGPSSNFLSDYQTISQATEASSPYYLIHVFPGTYDESVLINKPLTLRGESKYTSSINSAVDTTPTLSIISANATIVNLTVTSTGGSAIESVADNTHITDSIISGSIGIGVYNARNNTLENLEIETSYSAVEFDTSRDNTIRDSTITITSSTDSNGIYIQSSNTTTVTNNTILKTGPEPYTVRGIYLIGSSQNNNISGNTIQNTPYGIHLSESSENTIENNTITNSTYNSITSEHSRSNEYHYNFIENTMQGMMLYNDTYSIITHNTFNFATEYALTVYHSNTTTLSDNTIRDNARGLYTYRSYSNNITSNTFINNTYWGINPEYSENNNIWMNNLTDDQPLTLYNANNNNYCINGLDNYYLQDIEGNSDYEGTLLCNRSFSYTSNTTKIYLGHAINISADTTPGESSYESINMTIRGPGPTYNTSNHTMQIQGTNRIDNIWSFIYSLTSIPGYYRATILSYLETDDDTGQRFITSDFYFQVLDLAITTFIPTGTYHINDTITTHATITNNATEITDITSRIYWNNTLVDTTHTTISGEPEGDGSVESMTYESEPTYTVYTTTNVTRRSGNYTVNTTVTAEIEKTNTSTFFVEYGNTTFPETDPMTIAKNKITEKNITINATGGDLKNIALTFTSSDPSIVSITTQNYTIPYINASEPQNITLSLNALSSGETDINITATPEYGNPSSTRELVTVKELTLTPWLESDTINITEEIYFRAYLRDNVTPIEYVTANITWNDTSMQNITLQFRRKELSGNQDQTYNYIYDAYITYTNRSGNYTVYTEAKADITINDTSDFFVNYGYPNIMGFHEGRTKMNISENMTQRIYISAENGDLRNITLFLSSDNTTVIDLTPEENPLREIGYINYETTITTVEYNLTGNNLGIANISINITSPWSPTAFDTKQINVTNQADEEPPTVTDISLNSTISKYNLFDHAKISATIEDAYGISEAIAQVTKPDGYTQNIVMTSTPGNIYEATFTNTTQLENYTITIRATDNSNLINDTETSTFNITNIYPSVEFDIETVYNRGEDATIAVIVHDVNNRRVLGFNTTMNITYSNETTNLLPGNLTGQYIYYINTSILGIHNLSANISKNGNHGNTTGSFNVSDRLVMTSRTSVYYYSMGTKIRDMTISLNTSRGTEYTTDSNITIFCYNTSYEQEGTMSLKKTTPDSNEYTYLYNDGDPQCYAPTTICTTFEIQANITDNYNNTGSGTIPLSTPCYTQTTTSSSGGGSSGGGGGAGYIPAEPGQNITNTVYIGSNQTNITTSFELTLNLEKGGNIQTGENETITATIDNTGETEITVTLTIDKPCCDIPYFTKDITISSGSTVEELIPIHASLTTPAGSYRFTIQATNGDIEKTKSATITITTNEYMTRLETLKENIPNLEQNILNHKNSGIDTSSLEDTIEKIKSYLAAAEKSITTDDLATLESSVTKAQQASDEIPSKLLMLKTEKWLRDNKYTIASVIIAMIIASYLMLYFIIPFMYLKKEKTALMNKELELKDAEKSVQKQYFMRQLDDNTFNKLISEKHSLLLDTRSQIKRIDDKISLLKRGKLNLSEGEHSKYFILNRLKKTSTKKDDKKQTSTTQPEDRARYLKNQQYTITQSLKEAQKNYYNQLITETEYTQIAESKKRKLDEIEKELSTLNPSTTDKQTTKPKNPSILATLKKRYAIYRLGSREKSIKKKIHLLELKESILKKKETELKDKETKVETEIETLEKEEKDIEKQESDLKDSESPKPQ